MRQRIIIIVLAYAILGILYSCCSGGNKYNTKIISIDFLAKKSIIPQNENLEFNLVLNDSIINMARNKMEFQFSQAAYAFNCDESDYYIPAETVDRFQVMLLTDFNDNYKMNDDITNLIQVKFFNRLKDTWETIPIQEFFEFIKKDDRATGRSAELQNAAYIMTERPNTTEKQKFLLIFIMTDNSTLSTITNEIAWE